MFAYKPWMEIASRILLSTAILFSVFVPSGASASLLGQSEDISNLQNTSNDLASSLTIGASDPAMYEKVPVLSEQIAKEALQEQEERVKLKVWATPDIYLSGTPIRLQWSVHNMKSEDLEKAEVVIHTSAGLIPADPDTTYTSDGLVVVSLSSRKEFLDWNVAENAELPISLELHLLVNDDPIAFQTVAIEQPRFSLERGRGGSITGLNGKVEVEIPAAAISESLSMDIREPAPQAQPAVSLTWQPLEIIAVGKESKKNVDKFKTPIKIKIKYDEAQIFDWDENALSIYYYDPDLSDWFPLETTVDTNNNTLTAYSDHLTVFDYKANNWQSQSLPTIDAFKVSDFTGAGTYAINIWTPPGPGGLQPSVALTYNSRWSMNLQPIHNLPGQAWAGTLIPVQLHVTCMVPTLILQTIPFRSRPEE